MMCSRFNHGGPKRGWRILFAIPFILAFLALGGFVFMSLWNAVIPAIFGIKTIEYFQAIGLILIARILFGGIHRFRPHNYYRQHYWDARKKEGDEGADASIPTR
jgi:hypothetical protein